MAVTEMNYVDGMGVATDWQEYTSTTINCTWNFDADVVFMLLTLTGVGKWIAMINTTDGSMWFASQANGTNWQSLASLSNLTVTSRSLTYTNSAITSASVLPVPSKPNGYFS